MTYDLFQFPKYLANKENLICLKTFYYTAPPYVSNKPTLENKKRKEKYDKFIKKISENKDFIVQEGRCQRLKIDGEFIYKQKGVDSLLVMDLLDVLIKNPDMKKIILIASDSDFVPVINKLKSMNVKVVLYTYYQRGRKGNFSTNNELIKSVNKYVKLSKVDFDNCPI